MSIIKSIPTKQTAITQVPKDTTSSLPLVVNDQAPVPKPHTEHHVLIKVHAVALNPNDHKMVTYFNMPNSVAGCDLSGVVVQEASNPAARAKFPTGTRVCGALFPYNPSHPDNGSFAQYCVVDSRLLVRVPDDWTDLQASSFGVGWSTISLAISDEKALALQGLPTQPAHETGETVLVYGGATASGTFAMQMLKLMGYKPLAIASDKSANLAREYGAADVVSYTDKECVEKVKTISGKPIRKVLDCITDMDSAAICYSAMARTGGMYVCLEECPESWRTRRIVKVKEVMGFQVLGVDLNLGDSTYTRPGEERLLKIGIQWAEVMETLMRDNKLKTHPLKELEGGWQSIIDGLEMLKKGEVRGQKLVVKIPH